MQKMALTKNNTQLTCFQALFSAYATVKNEAPGLQAVSCSWSWSVLVVKELLLD